MAKDKFGSYGLISCVILEKISTMAFIDTWVMSCRVLNRTVEQAVFSFILEKANGNK